MGGQGTRVVALTMGDPAGVGPELCLAMLRDERVLAECVPVVFGDAGVLARVAKACGLAPPERVTPVEEWRGQEAQAGVADCGAIDAESVSPGRVSAACGRAAYEYIRRAVERAISGEVMGLATAPINKEALRAAGVRHPGHTEILAALTGSPRVCMMLASDVLTVSMVTTHVGLCDVPERITRERVREVIELTAGAVGRLRGGSPRIGVCGLNPHAGEHGLFGRGEEERAIVPAIEDARAAGIDVEGPIPPDTAFVGPRRERYGAIVCMYHDQGHIPFKMLAFERGVNVTLGLPIVRASVDHGTAFDIAWQGKADTTSMREAVLYAARLGRAC